MANIAYLNKVIIGKQDPIDTNLPKVYFKSSISLNYYIHLIMVTQIDPHQTII